VLRKVGPGLQLDEHLEHDDGDVVFRHACKMGLEGIVSKRLGSRYRSGRSPDWLKMKNPAAPAVRRGRRGLGQLTSRPPPGLLDDVGEWRVSRSVAQIGDRAAERPGELEAPFLTHPAHAFLPCLVTPTLAASARSVRPARRRKSRSARRLWNTGRFMSSPDDGLRRTFCRSGWARATVPGARPTVSR